MDPNETLRLFREHYGNYSNMADRAEEVEERDGFTAYSDLKEEMADKAEYAAGYAAELFDWLAKGGVAPDWTVK